MDNLDSLLESAFLPDKFTMAVLSNRRIKSEDMPAKIRIKAVQIKGTACFQFERQYANKADHRNLYKQAALAEIKDLLVSSFSQLLLCTQKADYQVSINEAGIAKITRVPQSQQPADLTHNRKKQYIIEEGKPCDYLIRLGVMSENGKVIASKYHKFKQINRFLEIVADVIPHLDTNRPLQIVDFGCGKSYLTFALYHYLHILNAFDVSIVGLDLKQDVVTHCNQVAKDLYYTGLEFKVGEINSFEGCDRADMVVSLHACDTATDDALARAIRCGADVIIAVPCCQHELFKQLKNDTMRPMLKHGIIKERMTGLITDSVRAQLLEMEGYTTQMLEFIEMEHTAKNILIRAVKRKVPIDTTKMIGEYREFRDFWNIQSHLEKALRE